MDDNRITYFGETDARNKLVKFGIKAKDRTRHVYVIGKTGMGKSTMLENMAVQDIQNGEGMCFIDPHGKTADLLLEYVPQERIRDVIVIAPFDTEYPISFNVLESVDPQRRHLVVSGLMSTFKKIWEDAWSARMEYILTNTLLALLEAPNTTLLGVNRMLSDKEYRKEIISHVNDPSVKNFWVKEFANYTERMAAEAVPAIQNKIGQFTANPLIRNMIGQPQSSFNFRSAMDERKIVIINLSKGRIGDENMKLLGGLLVTKIYLSAMSRADVPDRASKLLPNFYLFVDEFQNFANASFADILSEARKYKLNLTIAHQYIEQMDEIVRPAVFGNVGTMVAFRVGATDAELLEKEFSPVFMLEDLVNLGFAQIYLKLMIDGLSSQPFSATTLPPIAHPNVSYVEDILAASREQFSRPRAEVEEEIIRFHEPIPKKVEARPVQPVSPLLNNSAPPSVPAKAPLSPVIPKAKENVPISKEAGSISPNGRQVSGNSSADAPVSVKTPSVGKSFVNQGAGVTKKEPQPPVNDKATSSVEIPAPKPISLNRLGNKNNLNRFPRTDQKTPTPQNVNNLKDALAAIISKNKKSADSPENKIDSKPVEKELPASPPSMSRTKQVNPDSSFIPPPVVLDSTGQVVRDGKPEKENIETPKEVPQDVLEKVLKID